MRFAIPSMTARCNPCRANVFLCSSDQEVARTKIKSIIRINEEGGVPRNIFP